MKKSRKLKNQILMIFFIVLASIVLIEVIGLVWLKVSVNKYATFWNQKAQESGEITYVALGDSAAQGIGATAPLKGYVGEVAKKVEQSTHKTVRIVNLSKTGATTQDYLNDQAQKIKDYHAQIVTIEIGANDIKNFNETEFRANFKKVLESLPDGSYVSNMPLFNSRPNMTAKAKQASQIIEQEIKGYPRLIFVDLQSETIKHQSIFGFAPDLFHPNNLSYKNWTNAFWQAITRNNDK